MDKQTVEVHGGIEEAEMYARLAHDLLGGLPSENTEAHLEGAKALIEKSRAIMKRLITDDMGQKKAA